jgi:hypothetical protein
MLPYQALEQEMTLLGLTVASANKIQTVNPAKLDGDAVTAYFAAFNGIGQES